MYGNTVPRCPLAAPDERVDNLRLCFDEPQVGGLGDFAQVNLCGMYSERCDCLSPRQGLAQLMELALV